MRVSDADAGHPAASDASNANFNVDYYLVKWLVRDVVLGTELSGLTVKHSVTVDGIETVTWSRSEEHTSELQSLAYIVCRLLLEKKKKLQITYPLRHRTPL